MANNIEMRVGSALTKIELMDEDGIVIGFLKINLTDVRLVNKLNDIAKYFSEYRMEGGDTNLEKMAKLDRDLVDKFSYLLGYNCEETLFGVFSPTTIFDDGSMFAFVILNKISEVFSTEIKQKAAARAAAIAKYTSKYQP